MPLGTLATGSGMGSQPKIRLTRLTVSDTSFFLRTWKYVFHVCVLNKIFDMKKSFQFGKNLENLSISKIRFVSQGSYTYPF